MNTYRSIARVVGIIYLAGMVIGIGGNILIQSIIGTAGLPSFDFPKQYEAGNRSNALVDDCNW